MSLFSYFCALTLRIVKILAYQWIPALVSVVRRFCEICHACWDRRNDGRAGKTSKSPCNPIDEPAFHKPDPMIYSQYDLMAQGYAVIWDNPDIEVRKSGVVVPSSNLDPNTEYEIVARIWNKSKDAPVIGLPVLFYYLSFGNGVKGHPIGATAVNLGVKGGPDHPAFAPMKWKTPPGPGHYCILVLLAPVDDDNFLNNLGQENLNVVSPHSPAEFTFQLRNEKAHDEIFRFEVDTYSLPPRPPCEGVKIPHRIDSVSIVEGPRFPESRLKAVPPQHDRRNYPIPEGWSVSFDPSEPALAPGAEVPVRVRITAPPVFHGRQHFNVNMFDRKEFSGGVTVKVDVP